MDTHTGNKSVKKSASFPDLLTLGRRLVEKAVRHRPRSALKPETHRVISVGGGPRATAQAWAEMKLLEVHEEDFRRIRRLGGRLDVRTVIVERKSASFIGRGTAWGDDQGLGTVNSGCEHQPVPNPHGPGQFDWFDHEGRLRRHLVKNRKRLIVEAPTPIHKALIEKAFEGRRKDDPDVGRGVLMRAEQGREEQKAFLELRRRTQRKYPFYRVELKTDTSVDEVDIGAPMQPVATLRGAHAGALGPSEKISTDAVRLNTGFTQGNPLRDAKVEVGRHAFCQAMDQAALRKFFDDKGLLGRDGLLKPGTRLALGGTGLAALDEVLAVAPFMGLFEEDAGSTLGYKVSAEAIEKYPGALTFVSNSSGKFIPPRHAHGPAWTQRADPLGTPGELHACLLDGDGEEVFEAWPTIVEHSVANALGVMPSDVRRDGLSTEALLGAHLEATMASTARERAASKLKGNAADAARRGAAQTTDGALRQAHLSTVMGMGMARDPEAAVKALSERAPFSFAGRAGYEIHRAQFAGVTRAGSFAALDNQKLMKRAETMMLSVTASPSLVQACAGLLVEAGIAGHMHRKYEEFRVHPSSPRPLALPDKRSPPARPPSAGEGESAGEPGSTHEWAYFDALLVEPVADCRAEPVLQSLKDRIQPVHQALPEVPRVGQHRRIVDRHGRATAVENLSLQGKGTIVRGSEPDGPCKKIGTFATDLNNRESAVQEAIGMAYRRFAGAVLKSAGYRRPEVELERLYAMHRPTRAAWEKEVAGFSKDFDSAIFKARYLQYAELAAGNDPEVHGRLVKRVQGASRVRTQAALFEMPFQRAVNRRRRMDVDGAQPEPRSDEAVDFDAERDRVISAEYADDLHRGLPKKFSPPDFATYSERFVDVPVPIHQKVFKAAVDLAAERLASSSAHEPANATRRLSLDSGGGRLHR
jgi:hypothetical protein